MHRLKDVGAFAFKHSAGYERVGVHDICCCYKGRYVAIEGKSSYITWKRWRTDGSRRSVTQRQVQQEVRAAGGIAIATWHVDDVNMLIAMIDADHTNDEINAAVDAAQDAYIEVHTRQAGRSRLPRSQG